MESAAKEKRKKQRRHAIGEAVLFKAESTGNYYGYANYLFFISKIWVNPSTAQSVLMASLWIAQ